MPFLLVVRNRTNKPTWASQNSTSIWRWFVRLYALVEHSKIHFYLYLNATRKHTRYGYDIPYTRERHKSSDTHYTQSSITHKYAWFRWLLLHNVWMKRENLLPTIAADLVNNFASHYSIFILTYFHRRGSRGITHIPSNAELDHWNTKAMLLLQTWRPRERQRKRNSRSTANEKISYFSYSCAALTHIDLLRCVTFSQISQSYDCIL